MTDRILIRGLALETRIGVTERERSRPQEVLIDIELSADLSRPGRSDDLGDTIDYDALVNEVAELVRTGERNLLEKLAEEIASVLSAKEGVSGVTVQVMKQHVPVLEEVSGISVRVERGTT
jgi:FolB domain-containing protein